MEKFQDSPNSFTEVQETPYRTMSKDEEFSRIIEDENYIKTPEYASIVTAEHADQVSQLASILHVTLMKHSTFDQASADKLKKFIPGGEYFKHLLQMRSDLLSVVNSFAQTIPKEEYKTEIQKEVETLRKRIESTTENYLHKDEEEADDNNNQFDQRA